MTVGYNPTSASRRTLDLGAANIITLAFLMQASGHTASEADAKRCVIWIVLLVALLGAESLNLAANEFSEVAMQLAFVGDVMLGRLVSRELHRREPQSFWGDVGTLLRSCDATIANLECAISATPERWTRAPKTFLFVADPIAVAVLQAGNVRAVSLANNHILDGEVTGLIETLSLLDDAGIAHAGAGVDTEMARRPAIFSSGSQKVALFACVDHEASFAAGPSRPGTAYIDVTNPKDAGFPSRTEIESTRNQGAALAILSSHLGPNMVLMPSRAIRAYRRATIDRGIDIVHGHSAHLFQGIEHVGQSLILHDTSDILDDYATDHELHNNWSFIFIVDIGEAGKPQKLILVPVILDFARVRLAEARESQLLFERMLRLSAALGTHLERSKDRAVLELVLTDKFSGAEAEER